MRTHNYKNSRIQKRRIGSLELLMIVCIIGIVLAVPVIDYVQCDAKTLYIGYPSQWSYIGGCMIEVDTNQWIPLEGFRYVEKKR